MHSIVQYFIRYPVAANTLILLFTVLGLASFFNLKTTFFPEIPSKVIRISIVYPGASPEEIEKGVVLKIEDNLKGITGIDRVLSVSQENLANITVEVFKRYNTDIVLQDVKNAVDRISSFPAGMEPPVVFKVENLNFAMSLAIIGDVNLSLLKEHVERIENEFRSVKGISKVATGGYPDQEIEVGLNEDILNAYNLTFEQVALAIRRANVEISGGIIKGENQELLIRANNKSYTAEPMKRLPVKTNPDGTVIRLGDIAQVNDRWADNPSRVYVNGKQAATITIQNTENEDLVFISNHVKSFVEKFNRENETVQAVITRDGSVIPQQRKELLSKNGMIGLALVIVFLGLFLNGRLAFWVAIGIPVSFMGLFMIANQYGLTLNVISMFGMILVIGILVDDGIVIAENIYQKYEKGLPPLKAAIEGTYQVLPAVFTAVMTTVLAFSIFFFLEGGIGDFISDMAFVVIATLLFSLIEAVLILPAHIGHSKALSKNDTPGPVSRITKGMMDFSRDRLFRPVLIFCLHNKLLTLSIPVGLFFITQGAMSGGIIKTTFFPFIDRDDIEIVLEMPAGTAQEITHSYIREIEEAVWSVNEEFSSQREDELQVIETVQRTLGPGTHQAKLNLNLLDGERRNLLSWKVSNRIRELAGQVPGAESLTFGVSSVFGKPISVSLLSNSLDELDLAVKEAFVGISGLSSLKDVVTTDSKGGNEVHVTLKEQARMLGLSEADIINQIRQGFFGQEAQRLQRGEDEVKVWVRFNEKDRASLRNLETLYIRTPDGRQFPVGELADLEIKKGILAINHLNGKREIKIEADLGDQNASTTEIMDFVKSDIIAPILQKYPGVSVSYEGQSRRTAQMGESMAKVGPIIFLLIIILIIFTFRSLSQAFLVILLIPFGLLGAAWGHFLNGMPLSILSLYGIIALVGIIVNDALVLITAVNERLKEGTNLIDAVTEGSLSRFRPIMLTSITTILGLGPLMLEKSLQAQFLIPMATSVAYGLLFATVLTLLILPVFILTLNSIKRWIYWWWFDDAKTPEDFEPAVQELKYENEDF